MSGSLFPSQKASDLLEFPTLEIYDLYPKIRVGTLLFHSLLLHSCEEWIVSIALKEQLAQNKQIALYTFSGLGPAFFPIQNVLVFPALLKNVPAIFQQVHELSHASRRATRRLVAARFV